MFRTLPTTAPEWVIRLSISSPSRREWATFMRWLAADPVRVHEVQAAYALWRLSRGLTDSAVAREYLFSDQLIDPRLFQHVPRRMSRWRMPVMSAVAGAVCVAIAVFLSWRPEGHRLRGHDLATTQVGEIANYMLPDDTQLTVDADSSVQAHFARGRREIDLQRGEIFLDVTHDATQPFVVKAGDKSIVVTGTQFDVDYYPNARTVSVAVVEGTINVTGYEADGGSATQKITAGQVVLFPYSGPPVREKMTANQAAAWRDKRLYFEDAKLSDVLSKVNRYSSKPITSATPDIGDLTLSGAFNAGDIQTLLSSLRELYGIESRELDDRWLLVGKSKV
jgi:transmembrane sensor